MRPKDHVPATGVPDATAGTSDSAPPPSTLLSASPATSASTTDESSDSEDDAGGEDDDEDDLEDDDDSGRGCSAGSASSVALVAQLAIGGHVAVAPPLPWRSGGELEKLIAGLQLVRSLPSSAWKPSEEREVGALVPATMRETRNIRFAAEDSYNLKAFDQIDGHWPIGNPLPMPSWSSDDRPTLVVDTLWRYEEMVAVMETVLHQMLEETHYDTVHNYVDFYAAFRAKRMKNLRKFFQKYTPPVNRRHHMCVSLAMEIVTRLATIAPVFGDHLYLVSCEEAVDETSVYIENCFKYREITATTAKFTAEKEHALVAMKVRVAGREGMIVLDPGYHVARAVTIMQDHQYPHTGWFVQSEEGAVKREYAYTFSAHSVNFVEWSERVTRGSQETHEKSLVFVGKQYRTAIDVTVRRNLVYNFRSLLSRTAKGKVSAGIYFPVIEKCADAHVTLFYEDANGGQVKIKQKFGVFMPDEVSGRVDGGQY